jgi:hypothetical protein
MNDLGIIRRMYLETTQLDPWLRGEWFWGGTLSRIPRILQNTLASSSATRELSESRITSKQISFYLVHIHSSSLSLLPFALL